MRSTPKLLMLALLVPACGGNGGGSGPNTEVFEWSRSTYTTRDDVHLGDDVGEATEESRVISISPQSQGMCDPSYADVRIRLNVDYGEVKLHMGEGTHLVPRRVAASVLDNDVWNVEGRCEPQIRIPPEAGSVEVPRVLFATCEITLQHGDDARLVSIEIAGDRNLEVTAGFDAVRVE